MRALLLVLFGALGLVTLSCGGGDRPTVTGEPLATPRPAPTVEGVLAETSADAIAAQAVVVGLNAETMIEVRAQPGVENPLVGQVPAGSTIEPMGQQFTTPDGLQWWQVRADQIQGWTAAPLAYRGPAADVTEALQAATGNTSFASAGEAAAAITAQIAADRGVGESVVVSSLELAAQNSTTITTDVIIGAGSIAGVRVDVAIAESNAGWRPVSITQFELCSMGVNAAGVCL